MNFDLSQQIESLPIALRVLYFIILIAILFPLFPLFVKSVNDMSEFVANFGTNFLPAICIALLILIVLFYLVFYPTAYVVYLAVSFWYVTVSILLVVLIYTIHSILTMYVPNTSHTKVDEKEKLRKKIDRLSIEIGEPPPSIHNARLKQLQKLILPIEEKARTRRKIEKQQKIEEYNKKILSLSKELSEPIPDLDKFNLGRLQRLLTTLEIKSTIRQIASYLEFDLPDLKELTPTEQSRLLRKLKTLEKRNPSS